MNVPLLGCLFDVDSSSIPSKQTLLPINLMHLNFPDLNFEIIKNEYF